MMKMRSFVGVFVLAVMVVGCGKKAGEPVASVAAPEVSFAAVTAEELLADKNLLHTRIRATNPGYKGGAEIAYDEALGLIGQINLGTVTDLAGLKGMPFGALDLRGTPVSDLSPLKDMPLVMLGLEKTKVTDLSPLRGMKIKKLYLNDTAVKDISPLAGMPLEELMFVNNQVTDLSPLKGAPLKMLWLNNVPISDVEPIAGCPLMSLTLEGSSVVDLSPLAGHATLVRLHIGRTGVTDLSPLKGMKLARLIFTPQKITSGMDIVREMKTLEEIGSSLKARMAPPVFWGMVDSGK
jgi:internalin A